MFKNSSTVRPKSEANSLCSSVISSCCCLVLTLSGAIDCTVCSPSWATVFPHFLLPISSSCCLVFTLSGAIDCTVFSPSWATVFPHFLLPEWLLLEPFCRKRLVNRAFVVQEHGLNRGFKHLQEVLYCYLGYFLLRWRGRFRCKVLRHGFIHYGLGFSYTPIPG